MGRESNIEKLREKAIQETDKIAEKRRFALFSQPPGLCIGDNSYTKIIRNRKNKESGRVEVDPRQVQVACPKKGKSRSSYFQFNDYKG
jgi:hypothetical protein